ncbi:glycosyltransferase family 4 protein [Flavobacterium cellulosilyticum]|uniref:Glycosyltransferase family 1 protein n=1 Tax=Flavobacterium cellulosilyticum TaxID=2541731 RepID=A0A4R5C983_9FLAO|nr:glycosyltransferase [Flavobacterium cellulosilyticum]TDD95206.1 glycosyltransferase family 1 protein [Flavobacterium cellulosilyticum]
MNFVIVTHVPHIIHQNKYFAYAPYVREMNIWIKQVDKLIIVAPISNLKTSSIDISYEHNNIEFIPIASFDILRLSSVFATVFKVPCICWKIYQAMQKADHIHLRCPGNIGLLGCVVQILFPNKIKTAKYAGNWDPKSNQPISYTLQKWILSNPFLTKNIQVLVYGEWDNNSKNIKSFFTATYNESDKLAVPIKDFKEQIRFVFVGTLVSGKNPLYCIQLVEELKRRGYNVSLALYGEGIERITLEQYINQNNLSDFISLEGNQNAESIKIAYKQSHFVVLPSQSEGWPKAIAEGMFWGCVPIATTISCVPFMLDNGQRGILLECDLAQDANQIEAVLQNLVEFENRSKAASDWSRNYTLDVFEAEIKKLL